MQLTDQQIQELFRFCEKKYVRYYDLQVELVDHLAERIEEEMGLDPLLSFEAALQKVYKGFGLFGFAHIVREKENALRKQTNLAWWKEIQSFFTLPKVSFTAMTALLLYTLGTWLSNDARYIVLFLIYMAGGTWHLIAGIRLRKPEKKALMLTQYHPRSSFSLLVFFTHAMIFLPDEFVTVIGFTIWALIAILLEMTTISVSANIYKKAQEWYPEAFQTN